MRMDGPAYSTYTHCIYIAEEGGEKEYLTMPTIQKWGNSLAIRIPAGLAAQADLHEGTSVDVIADQGTIVVVPQPKKKFRLDQLLKECNPSQLHGETDFGPDVGHEVLD